MSMAASYSKKKSAAPMELGMCAESYACDDLAELDAMDCED